KHMTLQDRANTLFKQIYESKILKGYNVEATVSASLYIACREDNVPRSFKEICAVSQTSVKEIGRHYRIILNNLKTCVGLISTGDFMSRFCRTLSLPGTVQEAAKRIADKAKELGLISARNPVSVAAAAIYMASYLSDNKRTVKEICDVAGCAECTLKETYKSLYPRASELIPSNFRFITPVDCLPTH
ncbi:unnamed protein product, partial [Candidula unifasciata]